MTFQTQLGSLHDKTERVRALATVDRRCDRRRRGARRPRRASSRKCDLLTAMVGEFPELQGLMGRYYAQHDGEPAEVCEALREQYLPRFAGDALPATHTGMARRDRRQARHHRRHLRDRPEADRHARSVRPAPRGARPAAHRRRAQARPRPAGADRPGARRTARSQRAGERRARGVRLRLRAPAGLLPRGRRGLRRSRPRCSTRCSPRARPRRSTSTCGCARWPTSCSCPTRRASRRPTSASPTSCASRRSRSGDPSTRTCCVTRPSRS